MTPKSRMFTFKVHGLEDKKRVLSLIVKMFLLIGYQIPWCTNEIIFTLFEIVDISFFGNIHF